MLTRKQIEARRAELETRRDRQLAELNATIGALTEVQHWLSVLETDEEQNQGAGDPPPKE